MSQETLSNLLHEERRFEPPAELAANANVKADAYDEAEQDLVAFWEKAAERLSWDTKWDRVLDWDNPPFAQWYVGGKLNAAYNCVDRHVEAGHGDRVAYHWIGEPEDDTRDITYAELQDMVCQAANALIDLGREDRRPDRDLHADDPGDRRGDAGVRPARRPAHRGVRRLLVDRAARPDPGLRRAHRDHLRRWLPPRRAGRAEAGGGRGARVLPRRAQRARRTPHRAGRRVDRRTRRLVARRRRRRVEGAHARGVRLRAPAVRDVHVGHDGQAEGDPAHHRAATWSARRTPTGRCSTSRTTTSSGPPPTSAG